MSTKYDIYKQKEMYLAPKDATPTGNPTTLNEVTARYIAERQKEEANNATTQVGDVGEGTITDGSGTTTTLYGKEDGGIVPTTPTASKTNPDIVAKINPAIVGKTPREVVKDAKDADEWARYIDSLYSESDREADEKKKKAARWIAAAQMLGDSIAALGNSWATASGANAMALTPGAGKAAAATHQLEQDIRNAREKAAKAKMDATLKKYEMEMQRKKDEQTQANWQKTFDANEAYRAQQQKNFEKTEARLAEQAKINAENKNKPEMFLLDEGWVSVPKEKWTDTEVAAVYAKIPKEIRESIEKVVTDEGYGRTTSKSIKPTPQQMRQWIGEYKHHPEVADAIRRLAGVEPIEPKEGEVKSEVVVDPLTGKSYSVNPENPVIGGTQKKKPNPMNS